MIVAILPSKRRPQSSNRRSDDLVDLPGITMWRATAGVTR